MAAAAAVAAAATAVVYSRVGYGGILVGLVGRLGAVGGTRGKRLCARPSGLVFIVEGIDRCSSERRQGG